MGLIAPQECGLQPLGYAFLSGSTPFAGGKTIRQTQSKPRGKAFPHATTLHHRNQRRPPRRRLSNLTPTPLKHRMAKVDRQKAKYPKRNQQQRPPPLQPRRLLTRQAHTKPPIDAFKSYPRTNPPPNPPLCRRPECRRSRNNSPRNQPTQKGLNIRMLIATEDRQPRDLRLLPPSPGFRNMCHDLLPVNLSIRSTEFLCELTHHTIQSVIAFQDELIIELSSPIADWFNDVHIQIWLS